MKLSDLTKEQLIDEVKKLKSRKKYGLVWEDKPEDVVVQCKKELPVLDEVEDKAIISDKNLPTNLIIEGDNYHALSVLNYTHQGKIDVIYIDPPYNTGAKDWKYNNDYVDINDTYRHSKWLSFMEKRLLLAKNLLSRNGVIICTIDENEHATLGVLLNQVFTDYETACITIVHNPAGVQGKNFSYTHEYAYFVYPKGGVYIGKTTREDDLISPLRDWGTVSKRDQAKTCFYPITVKENEIVSFGDVCADDFHPKSPNVKNKDGTTSIYPIDIHGVERKWVFSKKSVENIKEQLFIKKLHGELVVMRRKSEASYRTVWDDKKYYANIYGSKLLNKIIPTKFPFPKSIYAVHDCIKAVLHDKHNATILDYFAGSGTTGHAVMMLNEEDGGSRKFILCTNNENKIAEEVTHPRIKAVIKGYGDVKGIPANLRYFKTSFVSKSNVSDDTRNSLVRKSVEMICVRENTFDKITDNHDYKIFKSGEQTTGILFNLDKIEPFKKELKAQNITSHIYVFSLTNDTYRSDFEDLEVEHELCPIPESILEVYRKLFRD